MKFFCAQCLKSFESDRTKEFCSPKCRNEFNIEERAYDKRKREFMRENLHTITGYHISGGKQAINFNTSDSHKPFGK